MCEACDLCFDLFFGQIWHETQNSLLNLLSSCCLDERFGHSSSLLGSSLVDLILDESLKRSELFPNHIGQCDANGIDFFADELIDARFDQGACDFEHAVSNDGFEEGHLPGEDLREGRHEQRFKHLDQPLF